MEIPVKASIFELNWGNLKFFIFTTFVAVIGGPLYLLYFDIPPFCAGFTLFMIVATGISISAGYHRLFAHVTYKAHPLIEFLFLFFGAAAFQHSALRWASQHRDHHNFVATDRDPYSIRKGFFYAHIGWLFFWKHPLDYSNVNDLTANPRVMHQNQYYYLWAVGSGVVMPLVVGLGFGDLLAAFIFPVCLRMVLVHQATFCVNSVCHQFGEEPYDLVSTAKDNWAVALLTNGEGFHNYHHRFPNDYRNGIHWYQWDSAKWLIALLSLVGLTRDLKKMSRFGILLARLKTNQQRLRGLLAQTKKPTRLERYYSDSERSYKDLKARLLIWEKKSAEYGKLLHGATIILSKTLLRTAKQQMSAAKLRYRHGVKQRKRYRPSQ